jgi:hypothetical protein
VASYQYRFANYSFQYAEQAAASHAAMDAMTADGWHVHTASANFIEVSILWERGGSATAERVQAHFEDTGVLPARRPRSKAAAEQG